MTSGGYSAARRPTVIVLDWSMPGESGGDILEALRRDPKTRALKVVVLSALADPQVEAARASSAGAIAWLDKMQTPPAELAERIGFLFEGSQGQLNAS